MTTIFFKTLYESSTAMGFKKSSKIDQDKEAMQERVRRLEEDKESLEKQVPLKYWRGCG